MPNWQDKTSLSSIIIFSTLFNVVYGCIISDRGQKLMRRRHLPDESDKGNLFSLLKDSFHLQGGFVTFALMIQAGSFKLGVRQKINENE